MTQPASFTDPGIPVDLTDVDLPTHCECGAFLPHANRWEVEDDDDELWAYVKCRSCGQLTSKLLSIRR